VSGGAVLVTGCSSGIGAATARLLASEGFRVYATARRRERLEALESAGCRTLTLDVTDEASMQAAVETIEGEAGALFGLVNNAGYSQSGAVEEVPIDRIRAQFETNLFGLVRLTQLVLPGMRRAGRGRIVNIGSMGGRLTFPGGGIYHATKHALEAISDALRFEVRGFGVEVVLVQPGLIRTGFSEVAVGSLAQLRGGGPYAALDESVARATTESYVRGPLARLAGEPRTATPPRPRYTVSASATVLLRLRALLPDRAWDAFLGRTYRQPTGAGGA
jgi:NADP-dependent 3-hydroxy acid dehydrogenase YdfG